MRVVVIAVLAVVSLVAWILPLVAYLAPVFIAHSLSLVRISDGASSVFLGIFGSCDASGTCSKGVYDTSSLQLPDDIIAVSPTSPPSSSVAVALVIAQIISLIFFVLFICVVVQKFHSEDLDDITKSESKYSRKKRLLRISMVLTGVTGIVMGLFLFGLAYNDALGAGTGFPVSATGAGFKVAMAGYALYAVIGIFALGVVMPNTGGAGGIPLCCY